MIVDFHTHIFPNSIAAAAIGKLKAASHTRAFTDGTADGLQASMRRAGIGRSVVLPVATNPRQVVHINNTSAAVNERTAETGLLSFGCMHPDFPDIRTELARIASIGIQGIKLHPVYQDADFDDPRYLRILDRAWELGLIVLVHAGLDVGFPGADRVSPEIVRRAVEAIGQIRAGAAVLVLAHMGGWRQWRRVLELLPDTGVYLDTSFSLGSMTSNGDGYYQTPDDLALLNGGQFVQIVRAFGAERVLFGTDCPWGDQAAELRRFCALPLTAAEQSAVLGGNAARLLTLSCL